MLVRQDLSRDKEIKYNNIRSDVHDALEVAKYVLDQVEELIDLEALEDEHRPVILNKAKVAVENLREIYLHAHYVLEPEDQYEPIMDEKPIIAQYPQELNAIYQI